MQPQSTELYPLDLLILTQKYSDIKYQNDPKIGKLDDPEKEIEKSR